MNSDFKDLLSMLDEEGVKYLIVGGYAVIHFSQPRYTKDLDIWLEPSRENAIKVARVFQRFGIPLVEVTLDDLAGPGLQYAVGMPPCMIDFLTSLPGLEYRACWERRIESKEGSIPVLYISRDDLILSKQVAGRLQDLSDIEELLRGEPGA